MGRNRRNRAHRSPYEVLGLDPSADARAIRDAHRALAKRLHPDAGGSVDAMQELNVAQSAALAALQHAGLPTGRPEHPTGTRPAPRRSAPDRAPGGSRVRRDHPSFTIEALPAVAFEGLLLAGVSIGRVLDDDPPYLLQVQLDEPLACWSQLELLPDAGATSVALTVASPPGASAVDLDLVRDRWITALNQLDWSDPASPQPPPS